MRKYVLFSALTIILALAALVFLGRKLGGPKKFAAELLSVLSPQNATVSSGGAAATSSASIADSSSALSLTDILQELESQQQFLFSQLADLRLALAVTNLRTILTRDMKPGDSGEDVGKLQELLLNVPGVYPADASSSDVITGYYGPLTKAAVAEYQSRAGLKKTGIVDKDTRSALYELAANLAVDENASTTGFAPIDVSNISDFKNSAFLGDQVSELALSVSTTEASVAELQDKISQMASDISNIQSSVQSSASAQNAPLPPDLSAIPAPAPAPSPSLAISSVQAVGVTKASSAIAWVTNNLSASEVDYSQNSSVPASQKLVASSSTLATDHKLILLNLSNGIKYYYFVVSRDSAGNAASSTILSFATLN